METKRKELHIKTSPVNLYSFGGKNDPTKTTKDIMNSVDLVIKDLKLKNNKRVKNLPKLVESKVKDKIEQLNDWYCKMINEDMEILAAIQSEVFDMILDVDKTFKIYESR